MSVSRIAVLSDVHDNLEAFQKALKLLDKKNVDKVMMLGDVLGYGASPNECLALADKYADRIVLGNHEYALISPDYERWFSPNAFDAIEWTRKRLSHEETSIIRGWSLTCSDESCLYTHASPREPAEFDYISDPLSADRAFRFLDEDICFYGHTHVPALYQEGLSSGKYLSEGVHQLEKGEKYLINPGSVGQPREQDKRLSFLVFDKDNYTVEIIRSDYDSRKAAEKIIQAGLPQSLANRLL